MAHKAQKEWCIKIKKEHAQYFIGKRVLDIGSLDVNGNNKHLFEDCEYIGLDVIEGKNVDVISIAHEYEPDELFDVVISTNALEHDMYFKKTLKHMVKLLKPGGFMFFSAAHIFKEHGTLRTTPDDSGTSQMGDKWGNYYHNISLDDLADVLDEIDDLFLWNSYYVEDKDLRFWGVRNETS